MIDPLRDAVDVELERPSSDPVTEYGIAEPADPPERSAVVTPNGESAAPPTDWANTQLAGETRKKPLQSGRLPRQRRRRVLGVRARVQGHDRDEYRLFDRGPGAELRWQCRVEGPPTSTWPRLGFAEHQFRGRTQHHLRRAGRYVHGGTCFDTTFHGPTMHEHR